MPAKMRVQYKRNEDTERGNCIGAIHQPVFVSSERGVTKGLGSCFPSNDRKKGGRNDYLTIFQNGKRKKTCTSRVGARGKGEQMGL